MDKRLSWIPISLVILSAFALGLLTIYYRNSGLGIVESKGNAVMIFWIVAVVSYLLYSAYNYIMNRPK